MASEKDQVKYRPQDAAVFISGGFVLLHVRDYTHDGEGIRIPSGLPSREVYIKGSAITAIEPAGNGGCFVIGNGDPLLVDEFAFAVIAAVAESYKQAKRL